MPARPKYYWDTSILLAWIKDEKIPPRQPGEMEGLVEIADEIDSGKSILIISAITSTELLDSTLTEEQKKRLELVLKRPSSVRANVDIRVGELAGAIRYFYKQSDLQIKTPDAIHLATAILTKADELHTFDENLLRLNDNVAGHELRICKPRGKQTVMKF